MSEDTGAKLWPNKLCNVLWMYALNKRFRMLSDKEWTFKAFGPGILPDTWLAREHDTLLRLT